MYICIVKRKIQIVMLFDGKITEIFCMADDFCKFFNETVKRHTLEENDGNDNVS